MGERVPQHIQNQVIRNYCKHNHLEFFLSSTEYAMQDCHLVLNQVLSNLDKISGIAIYSLFQLPEDSAKRKIIYDKLIYENKVLYFAVEGFQAKNHQDFERIEMIWQIRITLPYCAQIEDISI